MDEADAMGVARARIGADEERTKGKKFVVITVRLHLRAISQKIYKINNVIIMYFYFLHQQCNIQIQFHINQFNINEQVSKQN